MHILHFDASRLNPQTLRRFADALVSPIVHSLRAGGTLRRCARPVFNQRAVYNGWKRTHAIKCHVVTTPDGLHVHVFGPVDGRLQDSTVYSMSGLADCLTAHSWDIDGTPMVIYGDPAYETSHLILPFPTLNITPEERQWNRRMSTCREAVEWSFGSVTKLWTALDFQRQNKALKSAVGLNYPVATLLHCYIMRTASSTQMRSHSTSSVDPLLLLNIFMGSRWGLLGVVST